MIGFVETYGRQRTAELIDGFEVIPRTAVITHRGATLEEMDLRAVLARRPEVALVDEIAHTNSPGSTNQKRWQDIQELLDAGINVITTVNVQHLESLDDVVYQITGIRQRELVPDAVVRQAQQIELVDMTTEALRRRLAHGNVYAPEKIDAALGNFFRVGNLAALRELALLWVAGKVDEQLDRYRADHHIGSHWKTRERVVVCQHSQGPPDPCDYRPGLIGVLDIGSGAGFWSAFKESHSVQVECLADVLEESWAAAAIPEGRSRPKWTRWPPLRAPRTLPGLLVAVDANVSLATDILAYLLLVVAVALIGGLLPAVLAAVGGFLLLNYFFTPPVRMFTVAERENLLALFAFLVVARGWPDRTTVYLSST